VYSVGGPLESIPIRPAKAHTREDAFELEPTKPIEAKKLHYNSESFEPDLIRDLLFTFQGIDGRYVTFSLLEDCYIIQPNIGVSDSVRKMVGELCEMGWMYRKIIEYINMNVDETSIGIVT